MKKIKLLLMAVMAVVCLGAFAQDPLYYTDFSTVPVPADVADGWGTTDINLFTSATPDPETVVARNGIEFNSGTVGERMFVYPNGAPLEDPNSTGATTGRCYWVSADKRTYGETDHAFMTLPTVTNPGEIVVNGAAGENPTNGYQSYRVLVLSATTGEVLESFNSQQYTVKGSPQKETFTLANKTLGDVKVRFTITSTTTGNKNASINLYDIWIYGEGGAPEPTTPSIAKASGDNEQTFNLGGSIADIVYRWGGTATSANVAWTGGSTPAGVTVTPDNDAKTVTIAGTPTAAGVYEYSVTATDGTNTTEPLTGTITARAIDAAKKKLVYVTDPGATTKGNDPVIIAALETVFTVRQVSTKDALTAADFANDDIVLLSCVPGSGDIGIQAVKGIDKPFVSLKPFQFQWKDPSSDNKKNWGFGAPDNVPNTTTDAAPSAGAMCASVKVTATDHPIFAGITLTNNELSFASDSYHTNKRIVTFMKGWHGENESKITALAVLPDLVTAPPALADNQKDGTQGTFVAANTLATIFEITPGASLTDTYDGTATTWPNKNIFIGISEQVGNATDSYITEDFKTLVINACKYVLDMPNESKIITAEDKVAVNKEYFDITGKKVNEGTKGFIIEKSYFEDGTTGSKKLFIK